MLEIASATSADPARAPGMDQENGQPAPDLIAVLESRRSVEPAFLGQPGPSDPQTERLLRIASRVPDHGILVPWRFILLRGENRRVLSQQFAEAYQAWAEANQPELIRSSPDQVAQKTEKLARVLTHAPLIVAVISTADPTARKPEWEQVLSAGAVCMNLTAAASAMGFATVWLTGFPAYDPTCRKALGVQEAEKVAGFIHIGTPSKRQADRKRPDLKAIVTEWAS